MSKRKIRNKSRKRKDKSTVISPAYVLQQQLIQKNKKGKEEDIYIISSMINRGNIDVYKIHDPKYVCEIARNIKWTTGRLNKALNKVKLSKEDIDAALKQGAKDKEAVQKAEPTQGVDPSMRFK